ATHGEFFPFGGGMRPDGQFVPVAGYEGDEQPSSADVIALLKEGMVASARRGEFTATAIVYDVKVRLPSTEETSDAIAVSLNHRDNYSVIVVFPYKIDGGKLALGEIFAQKGEADIFSAQ